MDCSSRVISFASVPSLVDPPLPTHEVLAGLSEYKAACAKGGRATQGRCTPGG